MARQPELEAAPLTAPLPEVEIVAFAEDSVLSGRIRLSGERVCDVLNDRVEFEVTEALVEDLVDGHAIAIQELLVQRDELIVVDAAGPRGNVQRRRRTCQHPIVAKAGPYEVFGYVHALPGSDPIASLRLRKPIVAITDAVIGYTVGAAPQLRRADVLMLNQERADWIAAAPDHARIPEASPDPTDPLTRDFTGSSYD